VPPNIRLAIILNCSVQTDVGPIPRSGADSTYTNPVDRCSSSYYTTTLDGAASEQPRPTPPHYRSRPFLRHTGSGTYYLSFCCLSGSGGHRTSDHRVNLQAARRVCCGGTSTSSASVRHPSLNVPQSGSGPDPCCGHIGTTTAPSVPVSAQSPGRLPPIYRSPLRASGHAGREHTTLAACLHGDGTLTTPTRRHQLQPRVDQRSWSPPRRLVWRSRPGVLRHDGAGV